MARKPIHLQVAGKLTPRDRIWAAIRALGKQAPLSGFTRAEIADYIVDHAPKEATTRRLEEKTIETYVQGLVNAGHLEILQPYERYRATTYKLARDVGVEAPRVNKDGSPVTGGNKREAMWRSMKILKTFDRRELGNASSTETSVVSDEDVQCYIHYLAKAGYLQVVQKSTPRRQARYRFNPAKNTGPLSPQIQRAKHVYDPNLGQVVWHPEANS